MNTKMVTIKALSVRQPYAMLIASGQKWLELRSRKTHYRGRLLICASAKKYDGAEIISGEHTSTLTGHAVCIVRLIDCRPMTLDDMQYSWAKEFHPTWYVWEFEEGTVVPIDPFPVSGKLGIFEVTTDKLGAFNSAI